jgi:uncharacterized protein (DUF4415 family)
MNAKHTNKPSATDWARVDALTDETIDASDIPGLSQAFFERAQLRMPHQPVSVTVQIDADVLAWFQATGAEYEKRINAALRIYAEAHQV